MKYFIVVCIGLAMGAGMETQRASAAAATTIKPTNMRPTHQGASAPGRGCSWCRPANCNCSVIYIP